MSSDLDREQLHREKVFEDHVAERRYHHNVATGAALAFDKTFVALSGGGIALSFTLLSLADAPAKCPVAMFVSWAGFAGALLLHLLAQRTSVNLLYRSVDVVDAAYRGEVAPESRKGVLVDRLVGAAMVSFFLALLGAMVFAWQNFIE